MTLMTVTQRITHLRRCARSQNSTDLRTLLEETAVVLESMVAAYGTLYSAASQTVCSGDVTPLMEEMALTSLTQENRFPH